MTDSEDQPDAAGPEQLGGLLLPHHARHPISRIVDENRDARAGLGESADGLVHGIPLDEVLDDDERPGAPRGRDLVGQRLELWTGPGHERKIMTVSRKNPREIGANAARRTCDQSNIAHDLLYSFELTVPHGPSPASVGWAVPAAFWRSKTRSRVETPRSSATLHTTFSSNSVTTPSAKTISHIISIIL